MEYTFSTREKNGSVCLILSYKIGHRWKQKTRQGFKTKAEARRYQDVLLKQVREISHEAPPEMEKITLGDFLSVFLRDKRDVLSYNTRQVYKNRVLNFGPLCDMPLRDIRPADVQNAINAVQGPCLTTKNHMVVVLGAVCEYAKNFYKLILANPARGVKAARSADFEQKKIRAFTRSELNELLSILRQESELYWMLAFIAAHTGMRFGEVTGLCWHDIDFEHGTIHVRQQWNRGKDGRFSLVPLKTIHSKRDIPLSPVLAAELKKWGRQQPVQITGMLFPPEKVIPAHQRINCYTRKYFPGRSFHSLRHTFATLLLSRTGDVNLVANVLGDTVGTVIKTYLDYTKDIESKAATAIATLL